MGLTRQLLAILSAIPAIPVGLLWLLVRASAREGIAERLGRFPRQPAGGLWVHAASVGEVVVATRLIDALLERGHPVFASTTSPSGRALLRATRPAVSSGLAPFDHPWTVDRALARTSPRAVVLVETEIWPVWIHALAARAVPIVVVSGRISDRSHPRYRRARRLLGGTLRRLTAVGARSEEDGRRFAALGVVASRVSVTGDLKLELPAAAPRLATELADALAGAAVVVAGSTHEGEERACEAALSACQRERLGAILVVAPRHLDRVPGVVAALEARGRRVVRRSELPRAALAEGDVLVLDTLGELAAVYGAAVVAFVGGSLVPIGGHNLIEPIAVGRPVIHGPHVEACRDAASLLAATQGGVCVSDERGLAEAFAAVLRDPDEFARRAAAARAALEPHRGAVARCVELVEDAIAEIPEPTVDPRADG